MNKVDVQILYDAFVSLCDFIENEVTCGKCPLWNEICHGDQESQENFTMALKRIRDELKDTDK